MANTTFNGAVRSENGFKQISINSSTNVATDNFTVDSSGNVSGTGTMKMTGATNIVGVYESLTDATKSVTSADSGTTYVFNRAAGVVVTLPTAAAGLWYRFIVGTTITSNAGTIKGASANDIFTAYSAATLFDFNNNVAQAKTFYADGSDDDVFSMDGTTTGGKGPCITPIIYLFSWYVYFYSPNLSFSTLKLFNTSGSVNTLL